MLFENANQAFEYYYPLILTEGKDFNSTKAMFNVSFEMLHPDQNHISSPWRKWNPDYAEQEWQWYLSADPNATSMAKKARIWAGMMDENGCVNSNYGYQWNRNGQLAKVVRMLAENPNTRKAGISLYDGKEMDQYAKDTVCTYAVHFTVWKDRLNMSVLMRSNDLVFGFCNDQYCFSKLQMTVAHHLGIELGTYNHFAVNLHIYPRHFDLRTRNN